MFGGLGRATTEWGTAPRTKGRWNIQFLKLLLLPNALPARPPPSIRLNSPPARDSFGVGVLFPSFLLAPNLPAAFQPTISALVSVLLCSSLPGSLSLGLFTYTLLCWSLFLYICAFFCGPYFNIQ